MTIPEFKPFPKIPRLKRSICITEKIDGTNAQVRITDDGQILAGSRNRYVTPENDNYGFAAWVQQNKDELLKLGIGTHYGEWWGAGINRRYGRVTRKFSLFNTDRWKPETLPSCCDVVPILYRGDWSQEAIDSSLANLKAAGSIAEPGFMNPEGVVVYHYASGNLYKILLEHDELPKGLVTHAEKQVVDQR